LSRRTKHITRLFSATWDQRRKELGTRLRWVREILNEREPGHHSQKRWRDWLGINQSDLSRWEAGMFWPPIPVLQDIAAVTGASLDFLCLGVISEDAMDAELVAALLAQYGRRPEITMQADWHRERVEAAGRGRTDLPPPKQAARTRAAKKSAKRLANPGERPRC
jgi:hypothetical protein